MKHLFATLAIAALTAVAVHAGDFPDISIGDLKKEIASKKVTILDVNGSDSYAEGHVPGALDFYSVKKDLASKLPKEKDALIVAYCGGPSCSAYKQAAQAAKELGYTNVKHLSAGISGWKGAKETTEKCEATKEEKKDAKKSASVGKSQTYVGTMTGVVCGNCRNTVVTAFKKLPGVCNVEVGPGEKEGTQKVIITSTECVSKDAAVKALGADAQEFVVQELAASK